MVSPEGRPLSRRYFAADDERPLEWDEIVRGYEVERERFVVVSDDELERIAPDRTRDIDLRKFVKLFEIDPIHFDRPYILTPSGGSTRAYRLLARVMEETGLAGVATFVMRGKEYLVAILAENGVLRAETLRFADEIRTPDRIGLPDPVEPDAKAVRRIEKEILGKAKPRLDPRELVDRSAERLAGIAARKAGSGKDVVRGGGASEESAGITDLVEMLQRSLQGRRAGGAGEGRKGEGVQRPGKSGSAGRGGGDRLEESSRAELYQRAQEMDIRGRSRMSRGELLEAVRGRA